MAAESVDSGHGFAGAADAYDRFMGRYSERLARLLADLGGVQRGQRALDVGCGPGALTGELVTRLGAEAVAAVDPKEAFVLVAPGATPGSTSGMPPLRSCPFQMPSSTLPSRSSLCISWQIPSAACARWLQSPVRAASSPLASGTTPVGGVRSACSGRRFGSSIPAPRTNRGARGLAQATSPSCSRLPDSTTSTTLN